MRYARTAGFTLIELLICVVIMAIAASIGMPSYRTFIANQRVTSTSYDIYSSLVLARSESIKRGTDVSITAPSNVWTNGWAISGTGNSSIKVQEGPKSVTVTGPSSAVVYRRNGRITSSSAINFDIAGNGASVGRCITIDLTGMPNTKRGAC